LHPDKLPYRSQAEVWGGSPRRSREKSKSEVRGFFTRGVLESQGGLREQARQQAELPRALNGKKGRNRLHLSEARGGDTENGKKGLARGITTTEDGKKKLETR